MVEQHIGTGAGVTVAGIRVPIEPGRPVRRDRDRRPTASRSSASARSRRRRTALPDAPDQIFASMGNYVFTTQTLIDAVGADAARRGLRATTSAATSSRCSSSIGAAHVYDFSTNDVPGETERERGYWRDVGTLDAYYDAHMDLVSSTPGLQPLQPGVADPHAGPSRCRRPSSSSRRRAAPATRSDSMVCAGVIVSGGRGAPVGALARRARPLVRRGRAVGAPARRRDRARRRRPQRDPRQERAGRRRAPRSVSISTATASASSCRDGGIVVIGKGAGRRGVKGRSCSPGSTRPRSTAAPASTSSTWRGSCRGSST